MIIIMYKKGQLGNRLNFFAHFISFALDNNQAIVNPAFSDYAQYFEGTRNSLFCNFPAHKTIIPSNSIVGASVISVLKIFRILKLDKVFGRHICFLGANRKNEYMDLSQSEHVELFSKARVVVVQGYYFRNYNSIKTHADEIRHYFEPSPQYKHNVEDRLRSIRNISSVVVGIHIRQGDYKLFQGGKFFYTTQQYVDIMRKMVTVMEHDKVAFLVCSNSQQNPEHFSGLNVTFGSGDIIEDLYSLSACDYIMGTKSSFNRWASFYGNVPLYEILHPEKEFTLRDYEVNMLNDLRAIEEDK